MTRAGAIGIALAFVVLAGCGSSGGTKQSASTPAPSTTSTTGSTSTTVPRSTVPQSTTTTIGVMEYAVADVAVDKTTRAFGISISPDVRQCALVAWIQRGSPAERNAMVESRANPLTEDSSRRHLAGAFGECLSPADLHKATVGLIAASRLKNGECVATRFETSRLAPESTWLGLLIGFDQVSPKANTDFEAALRYCGA